MKNDRLDHAGYLWVFAAPNGSPGAKAHYRRRRDVHGDGHAAALRTLVNRMLGQLYRRLQEHTLFDELGRLSGPSAGGREGRSLISHHRELLCQNQVACSATVNKEQFWELIVAARDQVITPHESEAVAREATSLLADRPVEDIVAAEQVLWGLMVESYTSPLWAAAYIANGGCSDDGFDYFRGWLIAQGREVFERAVADPDALAELPIVQACAADGIDLEGEDMLGIAWNAHITATGDQLPTGPPSIRYPHLDPAWAFDFDDSDEMARRLPRLAALYLE